MKRFVELLWPNPAAAALAARFMVYRLPGKRAAHLSLSDTSAIQDHVLERDAWGDDVYFGLGLTPPGLNEKQRGLKKDLVGWPGLWVDIDVQGGKHKNTNLPPDLNAALDVLDAFHIPPTAVVCTGYGVHAYYLFNEPVFKRSLVETLCEDLQTQIRSLMGGWHLDGTADASRILRLPGTHNHKLATKVPVELLLDDGPLHSVEEIQRQGPPRRPSLLAASSNSGASPPEEGAAGGEALSPAALRKPAVFEGSWQDEVRRRAKKITREDTKELAKLVLSGKSFAKSGSRNTTSNQACGTITYLAYKVRPEITVDELYEFFRASIDAMAEEDSDGALTEDQVRDQLARALGNAVDADKILLAAEQSLARSILEIAKRNKRKALGDAPPAEGEDVEGAVVVPAASSEEFRKVLRQAVIQAGLSYYVIRDGAYQFPVARDALEVKMRDDFASQPAIKWFYTDANGNEKRKKMPEMLLDYCTVARHLTFDLTIQESSYDPETETFHEAVRPLRPLKPVYSKQIDAWLRRLGGADTEKLLDWVATITNLTKQTCALYISGPPGVGKTLLASGLARLWTTGAPTESGHALSNFNADIMQCPLVVADEQISGKHTSAELRSLIGSSGRTVSRKHLANAPLHGALRLMLLANNERLLQMGDEMLDSFDLAAIAERFLHVNSPETAKTYLLETDTTGWVDEDLIAQHALWLKEHRAVVPGGRFLVEGHKTRVHEAIVTQGFTDSLVIEWLASFLDKPIVNPLQSESIVIEVGKLYVNTKAITGYWEQYISSHKVPSTNKVGRVLHNISKEDGHTIDGRQYWCINADLILSWAKENKVGDLVKMEKILSTGFVPGYSKLAVVPEPAEIAKKKEEAT